MRADERWAQHVRDKFALDGRVALVTGASRGLGRGMALALGGAGADVAVVARTAEALEDTAAALRTLGRRALVVPADLSAVAHVQAAVAAAVDHFGRLDVLVNAAGVQVRKPVLEVTEDDWEAVVRIQLKAVYFASQAAARHMIARGGGKIINVGSLTASIGIPNTSIYSACKSGVLGLTRSMAREWAEYNIQVNCIGPGYYETAMSRDVFRDPEYRAWMLSRIPMRRFGVPEDLAGATIFLASAASNYITGQLINVDGGWLAS